MQKFGVSKIFIRQYTALYIWDCVFNNPKYFQQIKKINEVETDFVCYSKIIYTSSSLYTIWVIYDNFY